MAYTIPTADKPQNKYPVPDPTDQTALDAARITTIFNNVVNGDYRKKEHIWTTVTRPTAGSTPPVEVGEIGINTTINGLEYYTAAGTWMVVIGSWTNANKPPNVAIGSRGFNIDADQYEFWDGSIWRAM